MLSWRYLWVNLPIALYNEYRVMKCTYNCISTETPPAPSSDSLRKASPLVWQCSDNKVSFSLNSTRSPCVNHTVSVKNSDILDCSAEKATFALSRSSSMWNVDSAVAIYFSAQPDPVHELWIQMLLLKAKVAFLRNSLTHKIHNLNRQQTFFLVLADSSLRNQPCEGRISFLKTNNSWIHTYALPVHELIPIKLIDSTAT